MSSIMSSLKDNNEAQNPGLTSDPKRKKTCRVVSASKKTSRSSGWRLADLSVLLSVADDATPLSKLHRVLGNILEVISSRNNCSCAAVLSLDTDNSNGALNLGRAPFPELPSGPNSPSRRPCRSAAEIGTLGVSPTCFPALTAFRKSWHILRIVLRSARTKPAVAFSIASWRASFIASPIASSKPPVAIGYTVGKLILGGLGILKLKLRSLKPISVTMSINWLK